MQHQLKTRVFVGCVSLCAAGVLAYLALSMPATSQDQVEAAVFFSFAAFLAHQLAYRLPRGGFGDIAFIPLLGGVAVSPSFAIGCGATAALLLAEYFRRRE